VPLPPLGGPLLCRVSKASPSLAGHSGTRTDSGIDHTAVECTSATAPPPFFPSLHRPMSFCWSHAFRDRQQVKRRGGDQDGGCTGDHRQASRGKCTEGIRLSRGSLVFHGVQTTTVVWVIGTACLRCLSWCLYIFSGCPCVDCKCCW